MPKKAAVDKDAILEVLCSSKEAILKNGNIATPNASVWTELSEHLENKISAKALYTFVKLNRHNVWSVLGFSDPETNDDTDSETGSLSPGLKASDAFQLEIPFEKWKEFVPENIEYKDKYSPTQKRDYTVLKPGSWTHIVNDQIWKAIKSTCTFVFKRAKVYPSATSNYIVIRGYCKECHGHLSMTCKREPAMNNPMVFKCHISNSDDSKHTGRSKRLLSGQLRLQVAEELCEGRKEAHVWRASQATKLMDFGDPEPSHLPNLATHTVCFDATGSVVRKLVRPNGSSGHIFLYQGVLTGHNSSSVLGKRSAKLPSCFVRVDVAHCIKMICQWDCLKAQIAEESVFIPEEVEEEKLEQVNLCDEIHTDHSGQG